MATHAIYTNSWNTDQITFHNLFTVLSEETFLNMNLNLMVLPVDNDQINLSSDCNEGNELAEVITSLDRILNDNQRYDPKIFSDWIHWNIFCISRFLGSSCFSFEMETESLLLELGKKDGGQSIWSACFKHI